MAALINRFRRTRKPTFVRLSRFFARLKRVPQLFSWPRPRYSHGGGDAFVFLEIYGRWDGAQTEVSAARHNSAGLPAELVAQLVPNNAADWDGPMAKLARESNPNAWQTALDAPQKLIIRGEIPDPTSLDYLRDIIGVVAASLESGGVAVFEPQILSVFSAREWIEQFFSDGFEPTKHAVILVSPQDDGRTWLHTRGMRLFGRPDLSCRDGLKGELEGLQSIFNGLMRMMAAGALIPDEQPVRAANSDEVLRCFNRGSLDDDEFNNRHLALEWENSR